MRLLLGSVLCFSLLSLIAALPVIEEDDEADPILALVSTEHSIETSGHALSFGGQHVHEDEVIGQHGRAKAVQHGRAAVAQNNKERAHGHEAAVQSSKEKEHAEAAPVSSHNEKDKTAQHEAELSATASGRSKREKVLIIGGGLAGLAVLVAAVVLCGLWHKRQQADSWNKRITELDQDRRHKKSVSRSDPTAAAATSTGTAQDAGDELKIEENGLTVEDERPTCSGADAAEQAVERVSERIEGFDKELLQFKKLVAQVGTAKDSREIRKKLELIRGTIKSHAKEVSRLLKDDREIPRATSAKMAQQLKGSIAEMQQLLEEDAIAEREYILKVRRKSSLVAARDAAISDDDIVVQMEASGDDINAELLKERNAELRRVEEDMTGLAEITTDLNSMVHEQGEQLNVVEDHVNETKSNVQTANTDLHGARSYQASARRKMFFIALLLAISLAVAGTCLYIFVIKPQQSAAPPPAAAPAAAPATPA